MIDVYGERYWSNTYIWGIVLLQQNARGFINNKFCVKREYLQHFPITMNNADKNKRLNNISTVYIVINRSKKTTIKKLRSFCYDNIHKRLQKKCLYHFFNVIKIAIEWL